MELGTERNRSDVVATAQAAGLSISEGANGVQLLKFADQLNYDELKLMELPQEVLLALRSGERCANCYICLFSVFLFLVWCSHTLSVERVWLRQTIHSEQKRIKWLI